MTKLISALRLEFLRLIKRLGVNEEHIYFILTLVAGALAGLVAVFIHYAIEFLSHFAGSTQRFTWETVAWAGGFVLLSGFLTTRFFPSSSGSGIPSVRVALAVHHGRMQVKQWMGKLVTSILSLAAGVSLGREGPTVTVTSGIGSSLARFFDLSKAKTKALMAIGASGGIAAAFNTPIAAVVFTLEEIVGDLNAKILGSIVISSVIAAVTAAAFHGDQPTLTSLQYKLNDHRELFFYLFLGLAAAVVGPLWVKSVLKLRQLNLKIFKGHKLSIIMVSFGLVALISLIDPNILGSGHHFINQVLSFSTLFTWKTFAILLTLKFLCTTISYGSGISGGLFMPTLFMGAMLGALVGSVAAFMLPYSANTGAYALVGMGAFFAAVIRAPFTSIIIIFEMTRDYKIILPLMIANIVAYLIASKLHEGSIYESISEQDGIHLPTREDDAVLDSLHIEDAMITDVMTLDAGATIKEAMKQAKGSEISGFPVLKKGNLIGIIASHEIGQAYVNYKGACLVEDVCRKKVRTIYPDQSLMTAMHIFNERKISRLPVVSRINDRKLLGIITPEDVVNCFGFHIQEESKCEVINEYEKKLETPN